MLSPNTDTKSGASDVAVLFGVPIDNLSMDGAVERLGELVVQGRVEARTHHVTTVNVDFLVNSTVEPDLFHLLQTSDVNLADGMPVVWGSKWVGTPLSSRVTGVDLVPRLLDEGAKHGWRVHFFGGTESVVSAAQAWAAKSHPHADVSFDPGPQDIEEARDVDPEVIKRIAAVDADIVCVCLGNPKQERFIAEHREAIGAPVFIGLGGSLDLLAGERRRAPRWAQRSGFEWVFRAAQEPQRLGGRYARDIRIFTPRIRKYVRAVRRHDGPSTLRMTQVGHGVRLQLGLPSADADAALAALVDEIGLDRRVADVDDQRARDEPRWMVVDFGNVSAINAADHSAIVTLLRRCCSLGAEIAVLNRSDKLARCLEAYGTLSWVDSLAAQPAPPTQSASRREPIVGNADG